jgi:hypothetical protein
VERELEVVDETGSTTEVAFGDQAPRSGLGLTVRGSARLELAEAVEQIGSFRH